MNLFIARAEDQAGALIQVGLDNTTYSIKRQETIYPEDRHVYGATLVLILGIRWCWHLQQKNPSLQQHRHTGALGSMFMSGSSAIKQAQEGEQHLSLGRQTSCYRHSGKMHTHCSHSYPQAGKLYQACPRITPTHSSRTVRAAVTQTHTCHST